MQGGRGGGGGGEEDLDHISQKNIKAIIFTIHMEKRPFMDPEKNLLPPSTMFCRKNIAIS